MSTDPSTVTNNVNNTGAKKAIELFSRRNDKMLLYQFKTNSACLSFNDMTRCSEKALSCFIWLDWQCTMSHVINEK